MFLNNAEEVGKHLDALKQEKGLEDYCVRCGVCCFASVLLVDGQKLVKVSIPELPCKFLERTGPRKYKCSVYKDRFRKAPWCLDLFKGFLQGVYPDRCPYVSKMDNYRGTLVLPEERYSAVKNTLRNAIKEHPEGAVAFDPKDYERFLDL